MNDADAQERDLLAIATAMADGRAVDWQGLDDPDAARVRRLREIESIATRFRHEAPSTTQAPILFRWGDLDVRQLLASGSFGEVYLAHDPTLDREVALKLRRDDAPVLGHRDLLDEARRLAQVRHPRVLQVLGAGVHDGRVGLWSERIAGEDLASRLRARGPLQESAWMMLARDLCEALEAIHAAGLVHGDVKPANVLCEPSGRFVLADFGSAVRMDARGAALPTGTPRYLAPEVLRGEDATAVSDLYSLGLTLENAAADALTPHFARILASAVEEDPRRRPQSPRELLERLERASTRERAPRRPSMLATSSVVVFAVLVIASLLRAPVGDPAAEFGIDATFYRIAGNLPEPLLPGSWVRPGDRLYLDVRAERPLHLYVLNEDSRGELNVLFPLAELERRNPLAAHEEVRIPGSSRGTEVHWQVSSTGGRERFLAVASPAALPLLEERLGRYPAADRDRLLEEIVAPGSDRSRGVGRLVDSRPMFEGDFGDRLATLHRELESLRRSGEDVWSTLLVVENPPR